MVCLFVGFFDLAAQENIEISACALQVRNNECDWQLSVTQLELKVAIDAFVAFERPTASFVQLATLVS